MPRKKYTREGIQTELQELFTRRRELLKQIVDAIPQYQKQMEYLRDHPEHAEQPYIHDWDERTDPNIPDAEAYYESRNELGKVAEQINKLKYEMYLLERKEAKQA